MHLPYPCPRWQSCVNCAHHQGFSDEAPRIYVLKVERQTLVPSLALAEREEAADN